MQNSFKQYTPPKKKKSTYNLVLSMINKLKNKNRPPSITSMCIAFKLGIDFFLTIYNFIIGGLKLSIGARQKKGP